MYKIASINNHSVIYSTAHEKFFFPELLCIYLIADRDVHPFQILEKNRIKNVRNLTKYETIRWSTYLQKLEERYSKSGRLTYV